MEIKNTLNPLAPYTRNKISDTPNVAGNRGKSSSSSAADATGDRVSLSPEAKLRTEALAAAMSAPELRTEKVAALKELVDSGEYQVDNQAVAARLLEEEPGLFKP